MKLKKKYQLLEKKGGNIKLIELEKIDLISLLLTLCNKQTNNNNNKILTMLSLEIKNYLIIKKKSFIKL